MSQHTFRYILQVGKGILNKGPLIPVISSSCIGTHNFNRNIILHKQVTTETQNFGVQPEGFLTKISNQIKFAFKKHKLRAAGFYLYEKVADELDYAGYMAELKLPDTFQSWFLLTELHVWMIMARLMADPENGRFVRNCVVEALWQDVTSRTKRLGTEHIQETRTQLQDLSEHFQAAVVSYDEGLLGGDIVLAGAVWRRLLNRNNDPESLEAMVRYIRKTMLLFDNMDMYSFMMKKEFQWPPVEKVFHFR